MGSADRSLKSQLLIASPELGDPNFSKTVVLMLEHSEEGALGVVLNRPLKQTIDAVWRQIFGDSTESVAPVFWGGPVAGPLLAIHSRKESADAEILNSVYVSSQKESIEELLNDDDVSARFFIGCAGWAAGQLESEISEGAWQVVPATEAIILDGSPELWSRVQKRESAGSLFESFGITKLPDDPSMN